MTDVVETRTPTRTHTKNRDWTETELLSRSMIPLNEVQNESQTGSQVDLVHFESGSDVFVIALGGRDECIVPASDDSESAVLNMPGADVACRLQRVLTSVVSHMPHAGFDLAGLMERLWGCDPLAVRQRVRSPASTDVELSADKWMEQVRAWASSHPQQDRVVDDSRESIYGDRT